MGKHAVISFAPRPDVSGGCSVIEAQQNCELNHNFRATGSFHMHDPEGWVSGFLGKWVEVLIPIRQLCSTPVLTVARFCIWYLYIYKLYCTPFILYCIILYPIRPQITHDCALRHQVCISLKCQII